MSAPAFGFFSSRQTLVAACVLSALVGGPVAAAETAAPSPAAHHRIFVRLDTKTGIVDVTDRIQLHPARLREAGTQIELRLHGGMQPKIEGATLRVLPGIPDKAFHPGDITAVKVPVDRLRITLPPGSDQFTLKYRGVIRHERAESPEEYQRSFQTTPGIVSTDGVYLARSSYWLPDFAGELTSFELRVEGLPPGWTAVSEGARLASGIDTAGAPFAEWGTTSPVDDIHLIAGPFVERTRQEDGVTVRTFLRSDDVALSERYLEATGQYLGMYEDLIGTYPWPGFSLVENFWETGYGMPGFTLLGPRIIRFPFILHSSYPHELLHNWWGNGVYLPHRGGNWSEGLTSYLADHLVAEQRRQGEAYRLRTLSKFQSFVGPKQDFPLRKFRGRNSAVTEAVGYGKWLMVLHMLRTELGDDVFVQTLRTFYGRHRFKRASFDDFRAIAERVSRRDLSRFFHAWVDVPGMPTVRWSDARVTTSGADLDPKYNLRLTVEQDSPNATTRPIPLPVFIRTEDGSVHKRIVPLTGTTATHIETFDAPVLQIDIDPRFETFRRLLDGEIPPTLSRALGAKKMTFVTPTFGSDAERDAWKKMAAKLCKPGPIGDGGTRSCRTVSDDKLDSLPTSGAVWVLGYGNRLRGSAQGARRYGGEFDDVAFKVGPTKVNNRDHALVLAMDQPAGGGEDSLVFIGAANVDSIAGLARKIPHYGKYSYLAFTGTEPTNDLKGTWEPVASPMAIRVRPTSTPLPPLPPSPPLAKLPPPFVPGPLMETVSALAAPELEGRGLGSPGLDTAIALVAKKFSEVGLVPAPGTDRSFARVTTSNKGPAGKIAIKTLVARLSGKNPALPPVVLSAHLDHLGRGWPSPKKGNAGKIHPGANDNASGVAVLLAVAQTMKNAGAPLRSIDFVIFTAEEAGTLDSTAYAKALTPKTKPMAVVNLDAVGRQRTDGFTIFGGASAREWTHIFMGAGFVTGVGASFGSESIMASDHVPFLEAGVPAVHIFGAAVEEIHTPQDTVDRIDPRALVDAAVLTREVVKYLAGRVEPLHGQGSKSGAKSASTPPSKRRVSMGTVPDYRFAGPGVRFHAIVDGSPAAKAGLLAGDVLITMDKRPLRSLRQFTYALARKKPGETATLSVRRGKEMLQLVVTLEER